MQGTGISASENSPAAAIEAAKTFQRLGQNVGGYFGERIDISAIVEDARRTAVATGWSVDALPAGDTELLAFRRRATQGNYRVYISTGIHGDEPAGPLAALELLKENRWPECADLWLCPCLNPTGFPGSKRECALGQDLNRDYKHLRTEEVRAHVAWLGRQPQFDFCFCLHEDWEAQGFYIYELNPDRRASVAEEMIAAVRNVCPIDHSPLIDGREARDGIIHPSLDPASRPEWPEAFYLITHKTRLSYTLESPSDFTLSVRVAALVTAVRVALERLCGGAQNNC